ncbi:MAG: LPS export ABC transporter ATP-binding protein [Planctomycetota bacterium]|nr:MAG: LPS export ABC transporter ATP-binding protein [Planctomycetota bacterium]
MAEQEDTVNQENIELKGVSEESTFSPEPSPKESLLYAENIHKAFKKKKAVQGISLAIKKGEIIGLLGPNGAGKSTFFKSLIGVLRPDKGKIMFKGEDITSYKMYERASIGIAYLPQEKSIFRGLTVKENILAILDFVEPDFHAKMNRLDELLEELNLTSLADNLSESLSGGETRRLEFTRSMVSNPEVFLLDEPFAAIDPIAVDEIKEIIVKLSKKEISTIITDHNVRETLSITDRSYIINEGKLLRHGKPDELINDPLVKQIYLGKSFNL